MKLTIKITNEVTEELEKEITEFIVNELDDSGEYLVLDSDTKETELRENIEESLWAFNADFILGHTAVWDEMDGRTAKKTMDALREMQEKLCESANYIVKAMIEDLDEFIEDAVDADGAGHFLSSYDGEENECTINGETYYIYRTN